jgi:hypothetical protein
MKIENPFRNGGVFSWYIILKKIIKGKQSMQYSHEQALEHVSNRFEFDPEWLNEVIQAVAPYTSQEVVEYVQNAVHYGQTVMKELQEEVAETGKHAMRSTQENQKGLGIEVLGQLDLALYKIADKFPEFKDTENRQIMQMAVFAYLTFISIDFPEDSLGSSELIEE